MNTRKQLEEKIEWHLNNMRYEDPDSDKYELSQSIVKSLCRDYLKLTGTHYRKNERRLNEE